MAPDFLNAPFDYLMNRQKIDHLAGYDFYFGHYGYETYQKFEAGHHLITNFRNPVDRIYSIYRYWRHNIHENIIMSLYNSDAEIVKLTRKFSFSEFIRIRDERILLYTSNFHFRQLYSSGWTRMQFDSEMENTVRTRIENMPWFYVAENPDGSMKLFNSCVPEYHNHSLGRENASGGISNPLDPSDVAYLRSINKLDCAIHAYAVRLQAARLAALPQIVVGR